MAQPKPWEFTEGLDTPESWLFFRAYRDANGPRLLSRIRHQGWENGARVGTPTLAKITEWYVKGRWAARCAKYDQHMDTIAQQERELIARRTAAQAELSRKALIDTRMQTFHIEANKALAECAGQDERVMSDRDLTAGITAASNAERLEYGQVTERVERKVDLSGLSPEELAVLDKVILAQESED